MSHPLNGAGPNGDQTPFDSEKSRHNKKSNATCHPFGQQALVALPFLQRVSTFSESAPFDTGTSSVSSPEKNLSAVVIEEVCGAPFFCLGRGGSLTAEGPIGCCFLTTSSSAPLSSLDSLLDAFWPLCLVSFVLSWSCPLSSGALHDPALHHAPHHRDSHQPPPFHAPRRLAPLHARLCLAWPHFRLLTGCIVLVLRQILEYMQKYITF